MRFAEHAARVKKDLICPDCHERAENPGIISTSHGFDICRNPIHPKTSAAPQERAA